VVEPSCVSLVTASPPDPGQVMAEGLEAAGGQIEQSFALGDSQGDQAGVVGGCLIGPDRPGRGRGPGCCVGGGDRADRERGHDQRGVAQQCGVAPDLAVVEPEMTFAELETLLDRPAQARYPHQRVISVTDRPGGT